MATEIKYKKQSKSKNFIVTYRVRILFILISISVLITGVIIFLSVREDKANTEEKIPNSANLSEFEVVPVGGTSELPNLQ